MTADIRSCSMIADKAVALVTPIGLLVLVFAFIVIAAFVFAKSGVGSEDILNTADDFAELEDVDCEI